MQLGLLVLVHAADLAPTYYYIGVLGLNKVKPEDTSFYSFCKVTHM